MQFWTGVTDNRWYNFLSASGSIDEVNFWHPSGRPPFRNLPEGTPFLFKLKAPWHHIAGGGFLVRFVSLPVDLAWESFGPKNGADSLAGFRALLAPLQKGMGSAITEIGGSILTQPFFWPREDWIPMGDQFAPNIVSGKTFDSANPADAVLWEAVQQRLQRHSPALWSLEEAPGVEFGSPQWVRSRLGQGAFRAVVTTTYQRTCAITGEHTLPVLEAAHIRPVADGGSHAVSNGLLLRSDFHKLFDLGLVTVTPDYRVLISQRIHEQWSNGRAYYRLHDRPLAKLPTDTRDQPDRELLNWHQSERFNRQTA